MRKLVEADFLFHSFILIFHWFISRKHLFAKQRKFAHVQSNLEKTFGGELWSWKETKETRWICAEPPKCEPLKQRRKYTPTENLSLYLFQSWRLRRWRSQLTSHSVHFITGQVVSLFELPAGFVKGPYMTWAADIPLLWIEGSTHGFRSCWNITSTRLSCFNGQRPTPSPVLASWTAPPVASVNLRVARERWSPTSMRQRPKGLMFNLKVEFHWSLKKGTWKKWHGEHYWESYHLPTSTRHLCAHLHLFLIHAFGPRDGVDGAIDVPDHQIYVDSNIRGG